MSPADNDDARRQKLRAVERVISTGRDALRKGRELRHARPPVPGAFAKVVEDWKATAGQQLADASIAEAWVSLVSETLASVLSISLTLDDLAVLKWRLRDRHDDSLEDIGRRLLRVRSWLDNWGSMLIAQGMGHGESYFTHEECKQFASTLKEHLDFAVTWSSGQAKLLGELIAKAAGTIRERYDEQMSPLHVRHVDAWHIGWAMLATAWLLADVVGDSIPCSTHRLCKFPDAQEARRIFRQTGAIVCPRCETEITPRSRPRTLGSTDFATISAECDSCELVVQFPEQALPESIWSGPPLRLTSESAEKEPEGRVEGSTDRLDMKCDIAIVCALHAPELEKLLLTGLAGWSELPARGDDPQTYHTTSYATSSGQSLSVVASSPCQMGLSASAVLATKMILRFRPRLVAMVGIAAGVRETSHGFGDILAAQQTFDYGAGKVTSDGNKTEFRPDPNPIPIHPRLLDRLKAWERDRTELDAIQRQWPAKRPRTQLLLNIGPLASGAAVLDSSAPVAEIRSHWRKLIGVEMEAYGVHCACQNAVDPPPMFLCLKSICDFAHDKGDDWQDYAAFTSVQLLHRFIVAEWNRLFPEQ